MDYHVFLFILLFSANCASADGNEAFVTQTVYGFLDFTTTIGNTVMVFSPQSAPKLDLSSKSEPVNIIETKPLITNENAINNAIKPSKPSVVKTVVSTKIEKVQSISKAPGTPPTPTTPSPTTPSPLIPQKEVNESPIGNNDADVKVEKNFDQPEYDLLSRQPVEYAEESYRVVNIKSSQQQANFKKNRATVAPKRTQEVNGAAHTDKHPVGLVTKFSGSAVNDGTTTLYETSVLGTHISGKYAQVLQSSSTILGEKKNKVIRPSATSTLRILTTATPVLPKTGAKPGNRFNANRVRNKIGSSVSSSVLTTESFSTTEGIESSTKKSTTRRKSKRRNKHSRPSSSSSQRIKFVTPSTTTDTGSRKSFRPKIQPSAPSDDASTSLYMFKLNRTPGRWQYKTSPKPRVNIRKTAAENSQAAAVAPGGVDNATITSGSLFDQSLNEQLQNTILEHGDLESSDSQNGAVLNNVDDDKRKYFIETLNVEISTPVDFKDTYYEIATIKTPFIFQAGVVKKTRYITVTSTFEKILTSEPTETVTFEGPLTENILATATKSPEIGLVDGGTTTLNAIHLLESEETPALETTTESISITQTKLKTQILPVINDRDNKTSYITLVQTYDFTSLITATRTYSPQDPSYRTKNFKDIGDNLEEAGSEINLELEFGDENNDEPLNEDKLFGNNAAALEQSMQKHTIAAPVQQNTQQLNILDLFKQQQQQQPGFTVITTTRPVVKLETLWESHVVPIINGANTNYRTLSKSIGVSEKTEYQIETSTLSIPTVPTAIPPVNPYLLPLQNFQTITNSLVQQTLVTQTQSKILKLTFGARTALTTLYSTQIIPTAMTVYMTTTVPLQPSAAFPGYFPSPFAPFPYVG